MHILKDPDSRPEIFKMLRNFDLARFSSTYSSLATLLARLRRSTHTQVTFATPPGQTTVPQDPNLSGGSTSTTSSSSSAESKGEPFAQNVATDLLKATYSTVAEWMTRLEWVNPDAKLYLSPQHVTNPNLSVLIIVALSNKCKYVSARRNWLRRSMMAVYPCIFQRDPASGRESRRVVLSVEVARLHNIANKSRPNGKNMQRKTMKTLKIAMLRKHMLKCLVKYVILNSMM